MSGLRYYQEIISAIEPSENPDDVVNMIDMVAESRAGHQLMPVNDEHYAFAADIICVIFKPVKTADYIAKMTSYRQSYRGISDAIFLQNKFKSSLTPSLLGAADSDQAIKLGFDALFF